MRPVRENERRVRRRIQQIGSNSIEADYRKRIAAGETRVGVGHGVVRATENRDNGAERPLVRLAVRRDGIGAVIEHAIAQTHAGLAVPGDIPRQPEARAEIPPRRVIATIREILVAWVQNTLGSVHESSRLIPGAAPGGQLAERVGVRKEGLPADA